MDRKRKTNKGFWKKHRDICKSDLFLHDKNAHSRTLPNNPIQARFSEGSSNDYTYQNGFCSKRFSIVSHTQENFSKYSSEQIKFSFCLLRSLYKD